MIQYSLIQRSKWLYRTGLLWIMRINCIKFKISSCVTTNAFQGFHDSQLEGSRSMTMEFSFHWPYLRAIKMGFFTLPIRWCFPGARGPGGNSWPATPGGLNRVSYRGKPSSQSCHEEPRAAPRGCIPHRVTSGLRCAFRDQIITPEWGKMRRESQEENQDGQKVIWAEVQREDRKAGSGGTTVYGSGVPWEVRSGDGDLWPEGGELLKCWQGADNADSYLSNLRGRWTNHLQGSFQPLGCMMTGWW